MTSENDQTITTSCDSFEEFEDYQVEPTEPAYARCASVKNVENFETTMLELVQGVLDDLLADKSYWESSPRTAFDAICRLREKVRDRMQHGEDESSSSRSAPTANGSFLSASDQEVKLP